MTLRRALAVFVLGLGSLTLAAAASLVVLTRHLNLAATVLEEAVESIHVAEGAKSDLLLLARAQDDLVRAELTTALRSKLGRSRAHVGSAREAHLVEVAERDVEAYLAGGTGGPLQREQDEAVHAAALAIGALVDLNVEQARVARARAESWDRVGDVLGTSIAVALLAGVVAMLCWLRSVAFRPLASIAGVMREYGRGNRDVRARVSGLRELREIGARFNELADALEQHRSAELSLLAGVAHDLRNPLAPLHLALGLVRADRPLPAEERIRHVLAVVGRQVERLDRMVSSLLDTTRLQAGRLPLRLECCDARDVARETVELFRSGSAEGAIVLDLPDDPVPLVCDPTRVGQVLDNLLSNAIKYSGHEPLVEVSLRATADAAVYAVRDHGPGIAASDRRVLFEPFRRGQGTGHAAAGACLGLFVSQVIAEAHGGRIIVHSTIGEGSTFELRLPRAPAGRTAPAGEEPDAPRDDAPCASRHGTSA
ncbi:MAG: HAMP domain-containing sensor histidine kinase [Thermodesulfobacteriota bacterium]